MKKLLNEFKEFINRGNAMDLAIGIIIGSAFTAIVNSIVNDIITPLIALITTRSDLSYLNIAIGNAEKPVNLNFGSFINTIINFLVVAIVIFFLMKAINKFTRKKKAAEDKAKEEKPKLETKVCKYCFSEINAKASRCPRCTSELNSELLDS